MATTTKVRFSRAELYRLVCGPTESLKWRSSAFANGTPSASYNMCIAQQKLHQNTLHAQPFGFFLAVPLVDLVAVAPLPRLAGGALVANGASSSSLSMMSTSVVGFFLLVPTVVVVVVTGSSSMMISFDAAAAAEAAAAFLALACGSYLLRLLFLAPMSVLR